MAVRDVARKSIVALRHLGRPEFVLRPSQLVRCVGNELRAIRCATVVSKLPWGLAIRVRLDDAIGRNIARFGLYDLSVSEVIWRLVDEGETAFDVGANIGQMTSIMALRVGKAGRVCAFEPHPGVFSELRGNVALWLCEGLGSVESVNVALGESAGAGRLVLPDDFERNRGTAYLASFDEGLASSDRVFEVSIRSIDQIVSREHVDVGLIKLDVEGHELQVLRGASQSLADGRIRDVIFEEHATVPSKTTLFLQERGFTVFYIERTRRGVRLIQIDRPFKVANHEAPNYLATLEPARAIARLAQPGWQVLR